MADSLVRRLQSAEDRLSQLEQRITVLEEKLSAERRLRLGMQLGDRACLSLTNSGSGVDRFKAALRALGYDPDKFDWRVRRFIRMGLVFYRSDRPLTSAEVRKGLGRDKGPQMMHFNDLREAGIIERATAEKAANTPHQLTELGRAIMEQIASEL